MKHFINLNEIPQSELAAILADAHAMKAEGKKLSPLFNGLTLAMIFAKPSTRTRVSFDVGFKQLGGNTLVMGKNEMQLGHSETIHDTAKVLSRMVDAIMIRTFDHGEVEELARHASIPVINGLTDASHPCQIMADLMTIEERKGSVKGLKIAWLGDANNVANTFAQAAGIFDFELNMAMPANLHPHSLPKGVSVTADAIKAVKGADVVVTDTWVSMGQEGKSIDAFAPYQVNPALMAQAKEGAIFMHCLPAHRGEEVVNEVIDGPQSVVFDEAENRLHIQKAIMKWCLRP